MFSEAFGYLSRSLRMTQSGQRNYPVIRDNLKAALSAVLEDSKQPDRLKQQAAQAIQSAISYTYSRQNPMMPFAQQSFQSMLSPISPFQRNTMGPYGFVKGPIVPGSPGLVPRAWTGQAREDQVLTLAIRNALNIVRSGL